MRSVLFKAFAVNSVEGKSEGGETIKLWIEEFWE